MADHVVGEKRRPRSGLLGSRPVKSKGSSPKRMSEHDPMNKRGGHHQPVSPDAAKRRLMGVVK